MGVEISSLFFYLVACCLTEDTILPLIRKIYMGWTVGEQHYRLEITVVIVK